jgi:CDP-4-dehydro-6-deoxyglucose reductase
MRTSSASGSEHVSLRGVESSFYFDPGSFASCVGIFVGMEVREHQSQHEAVEELPLLTEDAVVTDVSAMDRNRTPELLEAMRTTLDEYGSEEWERDRPSDDEACEEWMRDQLDPVDHLKDAAPLSEYLSAVECERQPGEKLAALQGRYLEPYPSLVSITVETDEPVEFAAGQYLSIRFHETSRVYSVASSPNREDLEFCIRRVPNGELTPELSVELEEGDEVTLRGPYGELLLEEPSERDLVFLATGTGVAPFRSMIEYVFEEGFDEHQGEPRDVWLFLGGGWVDSLPYHEVFQDLADDTSNFHYVPTVSREQYLGEWDGETAYVQHALATYLDPDVVDEESLPSEFTQFLRESPTYPIDARLDPSQMEVYACGLTAMVQGLVDAAERIGVPPEHTQFEGFD